MKHKKTLIWIKITSLNPTFNSTYSPSNFPSAKWATVSPKLQSAFTMKFLHPQSPCTLIGHQLCTGLTKLACWLRHWQPWWPSLQPSRTQNAKTALSLTFVPEFNFAKSQGLSLQNSVIFCAWILWVSRLPESSDLPWTLRIIRWSVIPPSLTTLIPKKIFLFQLSLKPYVQLLHTS